MNLSIIVPLYNESESILHFIDELSALYNNSSDTEVIFVNDGSTDNTLSILKSNMNSLPNSRIINLYRNYGKSMENFEEKIKKTTKIHLIIKL